MAFAPAALKTPRSTAKGQQRVPTHPVSVIENPSDVAPPDLSPPARRNWLRTMSSSAANEISRRLIFEGSAEYGVGAWASAESTAWESLRWAAQAIDMADRESGLPAAKPTAAATLESARAMMREARDFSGIYGELDSPAIYRIAKSHRSNLLDRNETGAINAADAADRYLDSARVQLASIAARSDEAARTMDLLAAVYLGRADAKTLPSATALCLRRAALQGQPKNANLAYRLGTHLSELGLLSEARWTLEHSMSLEPNRQTAEVLATILQRSGQGESAEDVLAGLSRQTDASEEILEARPRVPEIMTLSPADFAALSRPVNPVTGDGVNARLASARSNTTPIAATEDTSVEKDLETNADPPGMIRRFMHSLKRIW